MKEHKRQVRKAARKAGLKPKVAKDPGIPNLWPHKEKLLRQIEAKKRNDAADKQRERERRKRQEGVARKRAMTTADQLAEMAADASKRTAEHERVGELKAHGEGVDSGLISGANLHSLAARAIGCLCRASRAYSHARRCVASESTTRLSSPPRSLAAPLHYPSALIISAASLAAHATDTDRRHYYREFKKVVESSDVLLEVLDARDPLGCRCYEAERLIRSTGADKKIILVLNKIGARAQLL